MRMSEERKKDSEGRERNKVKEKKAEGDSVNAIIDI